MSTAQSTTPVIPLATALSLADEVTTAQVPAAALDTLALLAASVRAENGRTERREQRHQKYAVRFVLDCGMNGRAEDPSAEPTDENLAKTLGSVVRPPRPDEYPAIRMHVDTYRMAQMSATDAVRDKLTGLADWYETEAPIDPNLRTLLNRRIADELRKFAASL